MVGDATFQECSFWVVWQVTVLPGFLQSIGQDFYPGKQIAVSWMESHGSAGRDGVSIHPVKMLFGRIQRIEVTQHTVGFLMLMKKSDWLFEECFGEPLRLDIFDSLRY